VVAPRTEARTHGRCWLACRGSVSASAGSASVATSCVPRPSRLGELTDVVARGLFGEAAQLGRIALADATDDARAIPRIGEHAPEGHRVGLAIGDTGDATAQVPQGLAQADAGMGFSTFVGHLCRQE
jgi:hypothetical protein